MHSPHFTPPKLSYHWRSILQPSTKLSVLVAQKVPTLPQA